MPKKEKDQFSGEPIDVFGKNKSVRVYNVDVAQKGITGIAFDFDDLLTEYVGEKGPSNESRYVFFDPMLEVFKRVRQNIPRTVILTSSGNDWVMRMARYYNREQYFKGVEINYLWDEAVQRRSVRVTGEPIFYDVKVPLIVGCNVIVDNMVSNSIKYPKIFGYTAVEVLADHDPSRANYAEQALKYIGAL